MVKILFLYETEMPTISIIRNYWLNLSDKYKINPKFISLLDVKKADLNWCDILMLIRPNNSFSWRIALRARASGRFVITMCDDDLLHLPKSLPDLSWQRNGFIKALNNSSVILSCNRHLREQMIGYTADKRGAHIDTIVKPNELIRRHYKKENKCVKIVYAAGGGQHEKVFEQLVLPALKNVASRKPNSFSLTFVSVHPNCNDLEKNIQVNYVEGMPLLEYREFMEKNEFDIGISPLENNNFTRCKYFNKYLEYTFSGIVGIYSNVEPYTYVVQDRFNGLLADNTGKSWEDKLILAIEDSALRMACAQNAQEYVLNTFNEQSIMSKLFIEIPELLSATGKYEDCRGFYGWRIHYRFLKCIEYMYKTGFYMKNEGIKTAAKKAVSRFKMLVK